MLWTLAMIGRVVKTALVAALLTAVSGVPSLAQANTISEPAATPRETSGARRAAATVMADYAAREAAAPELAQFTGGNGGVYIGGGLLTVVLLVLLIVILV